MSVRGSAPTSEWAELLRLQAGDTATTALDRFCALALEVAGASGVRATVVGLEQPITAVAGVLEEAAGGIATAPIDILSGGGVLTTCGSGVETALLAVHAEVLVSNVLLLGAAQVEIIQIREAQESRAVIEQAKGVLMAREAIDAETAFNYLVRTSQRTHRKLRDLAYDVVARATEGELR